MLIFGVAVIAGTAYLWVNDDVFLNNDNLKYTFLGISLAVGLAVVGGATDGIYGICKGKACHLCVFQIFVIVCMFVFLGVGVMFMLSTDVVFEGTCSNSKNPVINEANNVYNKSALMFCKNECPCALDTSTSEFQQRYTDDEKAEIGTYNLSMTGFKSTGECIKGNISDAEASLFQAIGNIEELLECSLWCPNGYAVSNLIYRFKDVNDGKPASYCYDRMKEWYEDIKSVAGGCFIGAGVIMTLMFICNIYLCCCAKSRKDKDLRGRFLYYN